MNLLLITKIILFHFFNSRISCSQIIINCFSPVIIEIINLLFSLSNFFCWKNYFRHNELIQLKKQHYKNINNNVKTKQEIKLHHRVVFFLDFNFYLETLSFSGQCLMSAFFHSSVAVYVFVNSLVIKIF